MTMRSTTTSVTFARPFALPGIAGILPAGSYRIDVDEESIESLSRSAWRRVATTIAVSADGETKILAISPAELGELLRRDAADVAGA